MNKIGLHIGYWWGTGPENNYDEIIRLTADTGVDAIEITPGWLLGLDKPARRKLAKKIADANLIVTVNGGLVPENDISSSDAATRIQGVEYCKNVLEALHDVGAKVWSGVNFSAWLRKGVEDPIAEKQRALSFSMQSMREIIKTAENFGVLYCFEVVNRYEQFLFNTAKEAVDFALEVDSPNASVLLDAYHMNIEEDDIEAALQYAMKKDKLGHFHLGESNRRIPGTGSSHMDWDGILGTLVRGGYAGAIVMEPFVLNTAHNAAKTCTWRNTCASAKTKALQADVKTGCQFLHHILEKNGGV